MTDTEITFARTRHVYDSYTDFWRLVELSEFPTVYVDEIRLDQPGIYITAPMNGDYREHMKNERERVTKSKVLFTQAHLILWNLERPSGSAGSVAQYARSNRELMYDRLVDEVWVSDAAMADETSLRYVILGSDYGLGELSQTNERVFDFCHMSAENPRRQTIYKYFANIGPNSWPPERDKVLQRSKFALNIHQDNHPFIEPLRLALFAAYGIPVLSETCKNIYPYHDVIMTTGYDLIVDMLKQLLGVDYSKYREMGIAARERMCGEYQFGKMVRQAVSESVGGWR